jgi:hypothetical protein
MSDQGRKVGPYPIASWLDDPEFAEALSRGYLDLETSGDSDLVQVYRTRIYKNSWHYSDRNPDEVLAVCAHIHSEALRLALREALFWRHISGPMLKEIMQDYGAKTFAELREAIHAHQSFPETEKLIGAFFIRNFPTLLRSTYDILTDVAVCAAMLRFENDKKAVDRTLKTIVKRNLGTMERSIKQMLGTRKRGGSEGKLEVIKRRSLHTQYDALLKDAKEIKKHYKSVLRTFEQNKRGYKRSEWQEFWLSHSTQLYDRDRDFLALFSEVDDPAPSDIAYQWLSTQTGHAVTYVKRLVIESRKPKKKVIAIRIN